MAFLESHQELRDHPKTKKAARLLGIGVPQFIGHIHLLWWWAYDYADDGDLSGYDNVEIAEAAMWEGDPAHFVQSLGECGRPGTPGFLEIDEPEKGVVTIRIHDWDEYIGKIIKKRKADADRKRSARLGIVPGTNQAVHRTSVGHPPDGAGTVPDQTVPNIYVASSDATQTHFDLDTDAFAEVEATFRKEYPRRNGKQLHMVAALAALRKLPRKDWPDLLKAVRNYAASKQGPMDPNRFMQADYWRDWITPATGVFGERRNGTAPQDPSLAPMPPADYSYEKENGHWKLMARDPVTGLYPFGCKTITEAMERNKEAEAEFLKQHTGKKAVA